MYTYRHLRIIYECPTGDHVQTDCPLSKTAIIAVVRNRCSSA